MKIAALFPGQGAQKVGMGKEFIETCPKAKSLFERADKILGYSLTKLCLEGPIETLTLTENAQPALLTTAYSAFVVAGIIPNAGAGHSLGEYTALVAAGALEFEDAVLLVHKRGKYMQEAVKPGEGKMVAVMGPSEPELRQAISQVTTGVAEIANLNSPGQTVIAGDNAGVDAFCELVQKIGGKVIPLNVSAPFHCRLMKPAADKLAVDLDSVSFNDPLFPIYSNVTAKPVKTGADARELLKQQVCGSVRWTDLMVNMIESEGITHSVEFGPGGVLTKMLKRINGSVARIEVFDPVSLEKARTDLA